MNDLYQQDSNLWNSRNPNASFEKEELELPSIESLSDEELLKPRGDQILRDIYELRSARDSRAAQINLNAITKLRDYLNQKIETLLFKLLSLITENRLDEPVSKQNMSATLEKLMQNISVLKGKSKSESRVRLNLLFQFLKEYKGFVEDQKKLETFSQKVKNKVILNPLR